MKLPKQSELINMFLSFLLGALTTVLLILSLLEATKEVTYGV